MLNKYPEIWLRESVKLVDLQTSSIFCLPPHPPPHAFLLWPSVTRLQMAHGTKEGRRPETLKPITIDQCALTGGGKKKNNTHLSAHTCKSVWIWKTWYGQRWLLPHSSFGTDKLSVCKTFVTSYFPSPTKS